MFEENKNQDTSFDESSPVFEPIQGVKGPWHERIRYLWGDLWMRLNLRPAIALGALFLLIITVPLYSLLTSFLTEYWSGGNGSKFYRDLKAVELVEEPVVLQRTVNSSVAVVHFRNINKGVGAPSLIYEWELDGGDSARAQPNLNSTFIGPEEDKFIVIPIIGSIPKSVSVLVKEGDFVRPAFPRGVDIDVINLNGVNTGRGFTVAGQLINKSAYRVLTVDVVVILRMPGGNYAGAMSTQISPIDSGGLQTFTMTWPKQLPGDTIIDVRSYVDFISGLSIDLPESLRKIDQVDPEVR